MLYMGPLAFLLTFLLTSIWAAPLCTLVPPEYASYGASYGVSSTQNTPSPTFTAAGNGTPTPPTLPTPPPTPASSSTSAPSPTFTSAGGSPNTTDSNGDGDVDTNFVATTWYAGWHSQILAPENISWSKYTSAMYAFATTVEDPTKVGNLDAQNDDLLRRFVASAHQNNATALLTIGGWTGSKFFSLNVGSDANRTAFTNTMIGLVKQYNLDGLDFDWEYPGKEGDLCNVINPNDSQNFLLFLQQLRAAPEMNGRLITAAASVKPFMGSDGNPMNDVSKFAEVLDYISIMNYDVWGSWSSAVGPNAPLDDSCAPPASQQGSATSAVRAWVTAGFPANKLVLGVGAYGHSFTVSKDAALDPKGTPDVNGTLALLSNNSFTAPQPQGDKLDAFAPSVLTSCGKPTVAGYSGVFNFWGMIDNGYLGSDGAVLPGFGYRFDQCSQTPYVYDPNKQLMISFDNPESFTTKGKFINDAGLLGFAMWETAGDRNDLLLDAISQAMGIEYN